MKPIQILYRGVLGAFVALAALATSPGAIAQTVTLNSTVVTCNPGSVTMQMLQNGNITITCTASTGGATTFACSASASPNPIIADGVATSTISTSCVNGTPLTYTWTNSNSAPTSSALTSPTLVVGPFTTQTGTFAFPVTVTSDSTPFVTSASLIVNAASTGGSGGTGGTGDCSLSLVKKAFAGVGGNDTTVVPRTGVVAFALPMMTAANAPLGKVVKGITQNPVPLNMIFQGVNNGQDAKTPSTSSVGLAISPCPGDMTASVPVGCSATGKPTNGALLLTAYPQASANPNQCALVFGTQYYLNVKFVAQDLSTLTCPNLNGTCSLILNYSSNGINF